MQPMSVLGSAAADAPRPTSNASLHLLAEEHTPYLWLLYSAEALTPDGSLRQVIEGSQRFAGDLAERPAGNGSTTKWSPNSRGVSPRLAESSDRGPRTSPAPTRWR